MSKIIIYGSKDFAYVIKSLVEDCGHEFVGFIDDYNDGEFVIGTYSDVKTKYPPHLYDIVIAIGYNNLDARWKVYQKILVDGYNIASLVHPTALISKSCEIGNGVIIMVGAIIDTNCVLNDLVVVWPGVVINHDSIIGENNFLSPNSTICGFVYTEQSCFIGAGAVIVNHTVVPQSSFIKAGQVYYQKKLVE
ncbi:hypothetical protein [Paenibacillus radicis (ex Xue et al. 2023)]|uniref:PglD N-terminal domain-containing protein n=1 Tax=Paenibacillus radicis (ex Xue et al. 2023) TaxID=2972489 RepID=A0ABT1YUC3_9BACL|nr:hypothetical protein [Paenibacillus radicis (ex Xue et al. 2023)]MCR8635983.1 hypothetical protein [Paenibacillus radicis (ex Xue et al. 2023)]